jgi:uncharacterized protein
MFNSKWKFLLLVSCLAIFSAILAFKTAKYFLPPPGKITTKGYAERKIISDFVVWEGRLNARQATLEEAFEQLSTNLTIVKGYLKENGIQEKELTISPIQTSFLNKRDEHGNYTHTIEAYELSCNFFIHSADISRVTLIAEQITQLIEQKIAIESYTPKYFYTKIDELKIDLLGAAAKDALARANQLAAPTHSRIHSLRSATQGVFQITPAYSTTISDSGENDTSTIEKSIRAVVTMEYAIL